MQDSQVQISSSSQLPIRRWLTTAALVLFGFWLYYPALSLPPSIIDDYVVVENADHWVDNLKKRDISTAISKDLGLALGVYNLGFMLENTFRYRLAGNQPHHWFRLLQLVFVCGFLFSMVYRLGRKSTWSYVGACAAVMLYLVAEVPGSIDMQSLRANWFRQFTAEPDILMMQAAHIVCIFTLIARRNTRLQSGLLMAAVFVTGCAIFTLKNPNAASVVFPLLTLALYHLIRRQGRRGFMFFALAVAVACTAVVYRVALQPFAPVREGHAYGSNFSMQPSHLVEGVLYLAKTFGDVLGPAYPAITASVIILVGWLWRRRNQPEHSLLLPAVLYLATVAIVSVAIYIPWNARLPRYFTISIYFISALLGLVLSVGLPVLWALIKERRLYLGWILAGAVSVLLPPWFLWFAAAAAVIISATRHWRAALPYLGGMAAVSAVYILFTLPVSRNAANNYYVGREFANWHVTLAVMKASAEGKSVCYAGDVFDEHIGSIAGHINRMGIQPLLYGIDDADHCSSSSMILVNKVLSPPDLQQKYAGLPVVTQYDIPEPEYKVPVSFETFRQRLLTRPAPPAALTYDVWSLEYAWRLYQQ